MGNITSHKGLVPTGGSSILNLRMLLLNVYVLIEFTDFVCQIRTTKDSNVKDENAQVELRYMPCEPHDTRMIWTRVVLL